MQAGPLLKLQCPCLFAIGDRDPLCPAAKLTETQQEMASKCQTLVVQVCFLRVSHDHDDMDAGMHSASGAHTGLSAHGHSSGIFCLHFTLQRKGLKLAFYRREQISTLSESSSKRRPMQLSSSSAMLC